MVTLPAGRMEARHGRGEISHQNARADRPTKGSSSPSKSEARRGRGRGGVSSPDWRVRMQLVQKRVGRGVKSFGGYLGGGTGEVRVGAWEAHELERRTRESA